MIQELLLSLVLFYVDFYWARSLASSGPKKSPMRFVPNIAFVALLAMPIGLVMRLIRAFAMLGTAMPSERARVLAYGLARPSPLEILGAFILVDVFVLLAIVSLIHWISSKRRDASTPPPTADREVDATPESHEE